MTPSENIEILSQTFTRVQGRGLAVYLRSDGCFWFVPTEQGDSALRKGEQQAWMRALAGPEVTPGLPAEENPEALRALVFSPPGTCFGTQAQARVVEAIEEEAGALPHPETPGLILRMGDILGAGSAEGIRAFYGERAKTQDEKILNPVDLAEDAAFIPEEGQLRGYGCGSPVTDADLQEGETVVDLGCGTGVECFLAAKAVGPEGTVIGIDMTDAMLEIAERSRLKVAANLGFDNVRFLKGFLEELPLEDQSADIVISNCVLNLCRNKRRVFQEIFRVLRPGGCLMIADVVCEEEPPRALRTDPQLTGECLGGALVQDYLFQMLETQGFRSAEILKRFPYRMVRDHAFFSLTYTAFRPIEEEAEDTFRVLYSGPLRAQILENGQVLEKGRVREVPLPGDLTDEKLLEMGIFLLDPETGAVLNSDETSSCCAMPEAEETVAPPAKEGGCGCQGCGCDSAPDAAQAPLPATGCLICGAPLAYQNPPVPRACDQCGRESAADALCENGHFICDRCHQGDPLEVIREVCETTRETDMLRLLREIRAYPCFSLHGPEHHGLVTGIILATYRNLGGDVPSFRLQTAIDRGSIVPGGSCGSMGLCGAGAAVGAAFAALLESNPLKPTQRQQSLKVTSEVLARIAENQAARCCLRESTLALKAAAELSRTYLPIRLLAEDGEPCDQSADNEECLGADCPLFPGA